jgi:hypothetical protein
MDMDNLNKYLKVNFVELEADAEKNIKYNDVTTGKICANKEDFSGSQEVQ